MTASKPTVFIVDYDICVRSQLRRIVQATGWRAETYENVDSFLDSYRCCRWGCAVVELEAQEGAGGLALLRELGDSDSDRDIPVIIYTNSNRNGTIDRVRDAGAFDFVKKPADTEVMVQHIGAALEDDQRRKREAERESRGGRYHQELKKNETSPTFPRDSDEDGKPFGTLSPRLHETLSCLLRGLSERAAAAEMGISFNTVHDYVKMIYKRLGVSTRGELFAKCMTSPLLEELVTKR